MHSRTGVASAATLDCGISSQGSLLFWVWLGAFSVSPSSVRIQVPYMLPHPLSREEGKRPGCPWLDVNHIAGKESSQTGKKACLPWGLCAAMSTEASAWWSFTLGEEFQMLCADYSSWKSLFDMVKKINKKKTTRLRKWAIGTVQATLNIDATQLSNLDRSCFPEMGLSWEERSWK